MQVEKGIFFFRINKPQFNLSLLLFLPTEGDFYVPNSIFFVPSSLEKFYLSSFHFSADSAYPKYLGTTTYSIRH